MSDSATDLARILSPEDFGTLLRWIGEQPNNGVPAMSRYTRGLTRHQLYRDAAAHLVALGVPLEHLLGYALRQVVEQLYLDDPRDVELVDVCMAYGAVHACHAFPSALIAVRAVRDAYR